MIQISPIQWQGESWKKAYADAFQDPAALLSYLNLPDSLLGPAVRAANAFPLRVPKAFAQKMRKADANDPLLLQVLPLQQELQTAADFLIDAVGDNAASPVPGLIHKYHGRVLIMASGACAIHCRYCFRRHFPYSEHHLDADNWQAILNYVSTHKIEEVIFSGGDPWSLSDEKIEHYLQQLEQLPDLQRLRWHTRLPVMIPGRITERLAQLLSDSRLRQIVVLHINHPNELDQTLADALRRLHGVTLLNQSVLLRNINDSAECLATLSFRLFELGILPYYLHELDKVQGAAHFLVERKRAKQLMHELAALLPGYLLPRYVTEKPGAASKISL